MIKEGKYGATGMNSPVLTAHMAVKLRRIAKEKRKSILVTILLHLHYKENQTILSERNILNNKII